MRYLNKIIFINSANIPYAEVQLDGNIHFIGTQGVGKSTILRAILFFYNADSRKLGIPNGPTVKSFADWYLGYGNSYIIYEINREERPYSIVAFKSQNRVNYRFIDSPYQASYFIKSTGEAYNDWDDIKAQLTEDHVNVSTIVSSYDQYRDIIYGNYKGKDEFQDYYLLKARQYKNIYRTIQNVFLNTKLDATEIKQTIISSMEDESISIDLEQYKHHLQGFDTALNEIKHFRFPSVQANADNAIKMLSAIREVRKEQTVLSGQLKYRLDLIDREKPQLVSQITSQEQILKQENQNKQEAQNLFNKGESTIKEEISQIKGKLKDTERQKKYYQQFNIEELVGRINKKDDKKLELDSLKNQKILLTNNFSDINNKYNALIKEQENQLNLFINHKELQKLEAEKEEIKQTSELNSQLETNVQQLEQEHEEQLKKKETELKQQQEKVHQLDKQKLNVKHTRLYDEEITQTQNELKESELRKKEEINNIASWNQQIESLEEKWKYEKSQVEQNSAKLKDQLIADKEKAQISRSEIENKINKSSDSLYDWLCIQKPDWKNTIGKVIDEQLLFQNDLVPELVSDNDLFYGVKLDLTHLKSKIKTTEDYQFELNQLNASIEAFQKSIQDTDTSLLQELENIKNRNLPKIRSLKEKVRESEYLCEQIEKRIAENEVLKNSYITKSNQEKEELLSKLENELDQAILVCQTKEKDYELLKNELKQSKNQKQNDKNKAVLTLQTAKENTLKELEKEIQEKKKLTEQTITQLKADESAELNNKGVNTEKLAEIEHQIQLLEKELSFIEKNRDTVSDYFKDKRELFDKEGDFRNTIKIYENKLAQSHQEYTALMQSFNEKIEAAETTIKKLRNKIAEFKNDEEKYRKLSGSSALRLFENTKDAITLVESEKSAVDIIEKIILNDNVNTNKQQELRENIDKFLSHFSDGNIFKFPYKLNEIEEYVNWAEELKDFIEEDRISEYEKRTNERFADIINSVGKETTMLVSKTGKIKRIINKINADFKHKNFVTAISKIEMDITESKNTTVLLLKKIKSFNDENALLLGSNNLFSVNSSDKTNEKAVSLLKQLIKEMNQSRSSVIRLTDSFDLTFRVEENGNDTGWVEKLTNVGSEGTDVLVKAMINIMLLNVFKEGASRKFKAFNLHCMMDEIGKLHPNNVKGILKFANERNLFLINGSPTENTPLNYRHIYKISKDGNKQTKLKRIISNPLPVNAPVE